MLVFTGSWLLARAPVDVLLIITRSIFDEPTSKMDPIASRAVFEKIESLRGSCTIVHITHDLSACLRADQVILFENGTNVEAGTHHELLAKAESRYRQFYLASIGRDEYRDDQEWEIKDEHCDLDDASHSQLDAPAQAVSGDTLLEQLEEGLNPGGRGTVHLQVPSLAAFRKAMHDEADTSHETEYDSGYDGSSASSSC